MGTAKTSWVSRGWGQGNERVEHRGFLGPRDYPVRPYNNASVLLCFCPNPQNEHHQDQILLHTTE